MSNIPPELLNRGVDEIIVREDLEKKLKSGKKMRIKFGIDPTASDLHLGHGVCLHKLREFQELGHKVVLIIGDFTARIGDPTGRSSTRKFLTKKEVEKNMKDYLDQAENILDIKKVEIRYNSEWFDKAKADLIMELTLKQTVARVLERNDFQKRLKAGEDIAMQEALYPLMQGYDSVMVKSDVELGGTDQKFNMLMGRDIQRKYAQEPQAVMTMPLLIGIDGKKKMSKSFNNYITFDEEPDVQYGKIMSIPDNLIAHYFELAARTAGKELTAIKNKLKNPKNRRGLKAELAREIVTLYHGAEAGLVAEENFNRIFRDKKPPLDMLEKFVKKNHYKDLSVLLFDLNLVSSKNEARRMLTQGAVRIDQAKIEDSKADITLYDGMIIQVGKLKFVKIRIKN